MKKIKQLVKKKKEEPKPDFQDQARSVLNDQGWRQKQDQQVSQSQKGREWQSQKDYHQRQEALIKTVDAIKAKGDLAFIQEQYQDALHHYTNEFETLGNQF